MNTRHACFAAAVVAAITFGLAPVAQAADESPDVMIRRLCDDVMGSIRSGKALQGGETDRIMALVDGTIMPNVDFRRMTAAAVGPAWRQATPEQQKRLQDEFKTLLVRTYAGALEQVNGQVINVKPQRSAGTDSEVVVRTEVRIQGESLQLDYRMEQTHAGWKIYDLNILGAWLVETYRSQFAQQINSRGIDGLVAALAQRNRSNAAKQG